MKIAYISYEVSPYAKAGGLADVAGALPIYLKKMGVEPYVIMPLHKSIEKNFDVSEFKLVRENLVPDSHSYKTPFSV
ncbi:MAG: glycogen/starch synthase, partial [Defluviitoga tunisiensis]